MESTHNEDADEPESDWEALADWADASVIQAKLEKIRAQLREWTAAAGKVPEPHEDLETIIQVAETMLMLPVPNQDDPKKLEERVGSEANTLRLLRREVNAARARLQRKAEKYMRMASRVDLAVPPEDLINRMTEKEAEHWNEASENAREEARRRMKLLNELSECEDTDALEAAVQSHKEENPDESLSVASYYRWRKRLHNDGLAGLLPQWSNSGR